MFYFKDLIRLYGRKVITDLATRYGEATEDSMCPAVGCAALVTRYWNEETEANIAALFEAQTDFDADLCKPTISTSHILDGDDTDSVKDIIEADARPSVTYNPYVHKTNFNGYFRHLEDIQDYYTDTYVSQITYRVRHHDTGIAVFRKKHPIQNNFINIGDNGQEITEQVDLLTTYTLDTDAMDDAAHAREYLPYVVKRLHALSRICKVHILSLISAYSRAYSDYTKMRQAGTTTATLKVNAVLSYGVYSCRPDGYVKGKIFATDKNVAAAQMYNWIAGHSQNYASYFQDYLDYIKYCEVLNIDYKAENMWMYQQSFISGLRVLVITPNEQYDKMVAEALRYNKPNYYEEISVKAQENEQLALQQTMSLYRSFYSMSTRDNNTYVNYNAKNRAVIFDMATDIAMLAIRSNGGNITNKNAFRWRDGYLYLNYSICTVPTSLVSKGDNRLSDACIISDTGFVVQVVNGPVTMRAFMPLIIDYINDCKTSSRVKDVTWEKISV